MRLTKENHRVLRIDDKKSMTLNNGMKILITDSDLYDKVKNIKCSAEVIFSNDFYYSLEDNLDTSLEINDNNRDCSKIYEILGIKFLEKNKLYNSLD